MDTIENTLVEIESQMAEAIHKQHLTIAKTINDVAKDSVLAGANLDNEFINVFPEIKTMQPDISTVTDIQFNPKFIIEIRNGKGTNIIDRWNTADGFLQYRKVMDKYYVDVGNEDELFCAGDGHGFYCKLHDYYDTSTRTSIANFNNSGFSTKVGCECKTLSNIK